MTEHLTPEALARLTKLAEAATPGEWSIVPGASNVWHFPDEGTPTVIVPGNGSQGRRVRLADAKFIAAANPDAIRALVAEVTRLREGVAGLADRADARADTSTRLVTTIALRALLDGGAS